MIQLRDSSVKGISFCIIIILLTLFAAASFSLQQTDLMKDSFSETFIESVNEMNSNPIDSGLTYLSIDSVQISIGGEETTSVTITNVVDLAAFQFSLSWDPLVVNIIGVDTSGSLSSVNYYYNNSNGMLNVNWFNIDGVSKDLLYVVNLTFQPTFSTNEGDWCFLNFSNSLLSDIHLNQIEYIIQNGTTTVIDNKSNNVILKIDSIEIPINGNGSVSVKAYNSQNLAGFQMNITYDPMIITVEEVNDTSSFFNQVHYHIHEELGIISLNSFNITGFNGDIPLFDILVTPAQGAVVGNNSHLNITDCIMGNADGEYLDFLIQNGRVTLISICDREINGVKFNDSNSDGSWDSDEETLAGWTINLYKHDGIDWTLIDTTVTTTSGYLFDELCPGLYKIEEEMQYGWMNTTPKQVIIDLDEQSKTINFGNKQIEIQNPDLSVIKSVKTSSDSNYSNEGVIISLDDPQWVTFKLVVNGHGFFDNVTVVDFLPEGLVFVNMSIGPDPTVGNASVYTWYLGNQSGMWSELLEFRANVADGWCGIADNMVNVSGCFYEDDYSLTCMYANDSVHVQVICEPDIEVIKEASVNGLDWTGDGVESVMNGVVWFKLSVKNTGTVSLDGVNVYDYLPDFLIFNEMIDDGGADLVDIVCEDQLYDLRWFFINLAVGETREIVFITNVIDLGIGENVVTVNDCPDPDEEIVTDSDSVEVTITDGMHIEKLVYDHVDGWTKNKTVITGELIQWKINVSFYSSNLSEPILFKMVITDILPNELNYVSGSAMVLFSNGTAFAMEPVVDGNELIWDLHDYFLQTGTWLSVSFDTLVDIDAEEGLLENKVNVSGKACTQTYYELEDTATVYVVMTDNVPPVITARSPADGSSDIDIDAVLSVLVTDPDNDMLTVVFYDGSDDSVIMEVSSIIPPKTVTFTWENLAYLTTYEWYVTVSDGIHMITSPMWNFTTIEEPINRPPHPPTNPNPANNTQNVIIHPTLSVQVSDPDGDMLTVYFYDGSTHTLIGHVVSQSGRRAITKWTGLTHGTTYSWYVRVNDSEFNVSSDIWSFTTKPKNIELDVEVSGGMGVTVEFINRGMDAAGIVGYEISVKSEGLLNRNRIDRSTNGTVNLPYNSVRSERIWLFNSGRITIDVSVTHPLLETPLTKRVDGILFGFFVIIHH